MKKLTYLLILGSAALFLAGCQKAADPVLELVSSETKFGPTEDQGLIVVNSSSEIKAITDKDWCTATVEQFTVRVKVALNDSGSERTATVAISNTEGKSLSVIVNQAAITFSGQFPETLEVPVEGGSYTYDFATNSTLKATVSPADAGTSVSVEAGKLIITVAANTAAARSSEVIWYVDGAKNVFNGKIAVNQARFSKPVNATIIFENTDKYSSKKPEATSDCTLLYGVKCADGDITSFTYYIIKKEEYDKAPEEYDANFTNFGDEFDEDDLATLNKDGEQAYVSWRFARGTEYVMLAYIENAVEGLFLKGTAATTAKYEVDVTKKTYTKADITPGKAKSDFYGTYNFYFTSSDYDSRVTFNKTVTFSDGGTETDEGVTYDLVKIEGITHTPWNDKVSFEQEENYWIYKDGYIYNCCEDHGAFLFNGALYNNFAHIVDVVAFENVRGSKDEAFMLGFTAENNLALVDSEIFKDQEVTISGETMKFGAAKFIYQWIYDEKQNSQGYLEYLGDYFFTPAPAPAAASCSMKKGSHCFSTKYAVTMMPVGNAAKVSVKKAAATKPCTAKYNF